MSSFEDDKTSGEVWPEDIITEALGGNEAIFERCEAAWLDHWNNEHVKVGKPWGGECCIKMAINAVLGREDF